MRIERKIADWLVVRRELRLRLHESETGMTASVLKQDPSTSKVFKRMLFITILGQKTQDANFRGNPVYQAKNLHLNNS